MQKAYSKYTNGECLFFLNLETTSWSFIYNYSFPSYFMLNKRMCIRNNQKKKNLFRLRRTISLYVYIIQKYLH